MATAPFPVRSSLRVHNRQPFWFLGQESSPCDPWPLRKYPSMVTILDVAGRLVVVETLSSRFSWLSAVIMNAVNDIMFELLFAKEKYDGY